MSALTMTLVSACAGGDHLTFSITGAKTLSVSINASDMTSPITDDDLAAYLKITARLCKIGKTVAQAKTALQAGITVTA